MKKILFALQLLLPLTSLAQNFPTSLKIMGRGIENRSTREIALLACTGAGGGCEHVRLLSLKNGQPIWLDVDFPAINTIDAEATLLKRYSKSRVVEILDHFSSKDIYAMSDTKGWNWSENPLRLSDKDFHYVVGEFLYIASVIQNSGSLKDTTAPQNDRLDLSLSERIDESMQEKTVAAFLGRIIFGRISSLGLETQVARMQEQGITHQKFIAGFNAQGAIAFHHELNQEKREGYAKTDGLQLIPYEIHLLADGRKKVSMSAFGIQNFHNLADANPSDYGGWDYLENLKLIEFVWDDQYTLSNMKSIDFKLINFQLEAPVVINGDNDYSSPRKNYFKIKLRAGGDLGVNKAWMNTETGITNLGRSQPQKDEQVDPDVFNGPYELENEVFGSSAFNKELPNDYFKSNHAALTAGYNLGVQFDYKRNVNQFSFKASYVFRFTNYRTTDGRIYYVEKDSGDLQNVQFKMQEFTNTNRYLKYNGFQFKVDFTHTLKNNKSQIGFGAESNVPLNYRLKNHNVDLTKNYNEIFKGRIYLNF